MQQDVEVLAAPELKGVKMTQKKTPKSGPPALFWVLFGDPFGALVEPNTSSLPEHFPKQLYIVGFEPHPVNFRRLTAGVSGASHIGGARKLPKKCPLGSVVLPPCF